MKRLGLWSMVAVGMALAIGGLCVSGQEVVGTLTNFDVVNFTECPVDDFVVCFTRIFDPTCIEGWFDGWGTPPTVTENPEGICVRWVDCDHGILPGEVVHFGLYLRPECLAYMLDLGTCVHAWWTIGGIRVREVPLPVQFWQARDGSVFDIVRYCNDDIGPVEITREYATISERIPLDSLTWEMTDQIVRHSGAEWVLAERGEAFYPNGKDLPLEIPVGPNDRSVIVRYTVSLNGTIVTRVINEAYIIPPCR